MFIDPFSGSYNPMNPVLPDDGGTVGGGGGSGGGGGGGGGDGGGGGGGGGGFSPTPEIISTVPTDDQTGNFGQDNQIVNPDINYDNPFVADNNQIVGVLDPTDESLAIVNDAYGIDPSFYTDSPIYSASDFPVGSSATATDFTKYADNTNDNNAATNEFGSTVSVGYGQGQVDPRLATAAGYTGQPSGVLSSIFGPTSAATQERLADEIADRAKSTDNSAQRRASELNAAIQNVGGQELLDSGATLAGDQTMSLQSQFGTLTTTQVADQASLSQKGVPTGKGSVKDTRKVLDKAARDGNLGAYVDSFMGKFGNDLGGFKEKTGISNSILKDIQKIAAAKVTT